MYRNKSFDEDLAERLRNPRFARGFLLAMLEGDGGLDLETALRYTITRMGIKEFSQLSGLAPSNIVRFVKGRSHPKPATLNAMLKPFRLRTKIVLEKAA